MKTKNCKTFTIIELLVVIAIITVLASMLLPALNRARDRAFAASCMSNEKQLLKAALLYVNDYEGYLPAASYDIVDYATPKHWISILAKYLGATSLYSTVPQVFFCPKDASRTANYKHILKTYALRYEISYIPNGYSGMYYLGVCTRAKKLTRIEQPSMYVQYGKRAELIDVGRTSLPDMFRWEYESTDPLSWWSALQVNRHGNSSNYGFVDGHVESLQIPYAKKGSSDYDKYFIR